MATGWCKWGDECWNGHPEPPGFDSAVQPAADLNSFGFPKRPDAEECGFYVKTGNCKFGEACKYHHPEPEEIEARQAKGFHAAGGAGRADPDVKLTSEGFPSRPDAEQCMFFMRTGSCKFGANCRYDHPEGAAAAIKLAAGSKGADPPPPAALNEQNLPLRPGEPHCAFYLRSGNCKFGTSCRFDHPAGMGGIGNLPGLGDGAQLNEAGMPLRPGKELCAFFLKTGKCEFGPSCRFNHPPGMVPGSADGEKDGPAAAAPVNEKGLPIRTGKEVCPFYAKSGTCKYGPGCRYDHPAAPKGREAGLGGRRSRRPPPSTYQKL